MEDRMCSKSLRYLKADIYRITKSNSVKKIVKNATINRNFRPIFTMRICKYLNSKIHYYQKLY